MDKKGCKFNVPGTRRLFKAIKRFPKFTNVVRKLSVDITRRLLHVNFFMKSAMQERVVNIELV